MIIESDANIIKIHFESYAKRLIQIFQYYNPDFMAKEKHVGTFSDNQETKDTANDNNVESPAQKKEYIFLNKDQFTWNASIDQQCR